MPETNSYIVPGMKDDELTTSQVEELLGVSRLTVMRWSKKGILKFRTQRLGAYDWKFYRRSDVLKIKANMDKDPGVGHSYLEKEAKKGSKRKKPRKTNPN